ncbi:MAG: CubicO group peptidase (beta-lactamase class C family) [Hyphomicrobiaceae bacterium]|jgi:CubicO group peptidase (beta-lactamase class C family)
MEGRIHPDFWPVARALKAQLPTDGKGGAAVCVYHRGRKVIDLWGGTRDEDGTPWTEDTVSLSYSTTKGVASTLLHILVDRAELDYDDPVSRYWPEFAQAGKKDLTVRQVMCHEAGLYGIRSMTDHARRMMDWEYMIDSIAAAEPRHLPGKEHGYHGLTYGYIVGEIIQRVAGVSFAEFLNTELVEPLGLDGMFVGMPEEALGRRAKLIMAGIQAGKGNADRFIEYLNSTNRWLRWLSIPIDLDEVVNSLLPEGMDELDWNSEEFVKSCVPSANGMFTARSLARMYAMMAAGGELDGVRIISEKTIRKARKVQNTTMDRVIPFPMHWRLGYHRVFTMGPRIPHGFGHFGFGGSGAWADPDRNLSVGLVLNSGVGTPFGDSRILRITTAALRCADRRK